MLTWLIDYLTTNAGGWTYPLVLLLVVLDASVFLGFLLPGEAPLLVGGVLAGRGVINLLGIGVVAACGAIIGDSLSYLLGKWIGEERAVKWGQHIGVTQERMARADDFFAAHGGKAIFAGRSASVFRPVRRGRFGAAVLALHLVQCACRNRLGEHLHRTGLLGGRAVA